MTSSKVSRQNEDLISNVPDIVTNKILELLPIWMQARTSLVSKQWRRNWLSLQRLNFNNEFFKKYENKDGICNSLQKCDDIICSVLFRHKTVHDFKLFIPGTFDIGFPHLSVWLFLLSRKVVKRITLDNFWDHLHLSSYTFSYIFAYISLLIFSLDNLTKLCLFDLTGDFIVDYIFDMIESCPSIKELTISISQFPYYMTSKTANQPKIICNGNQRLDHLLDIKISGITGSNAELKLIEYLLAHSVVLETLSLNLGERNTASALKLRRALMGFPKASIKARLIYCDIIPGLTDDI